MTAFRQPRNSILGIFFLAMTIANVMTVPRLVPYLHNGYQNFTIFYGAGLTVRQGQTAQLYDLSAQYRVQRQFAPDVAIRQAALPFNHPAFESLLFVPLTFLPYWPAYLLWTAFNLSLILASFWILRLQSSKLSSFVLVVLLLAAIGFYPLASALVQGQDCILLLLLYVCAFVVFENDHPVTTGAVLALGLFRFQLILPLIVILAFRRPRVLVGFAPLAAVFAALSLTMVGWSGTSQYISLLVSTEKSGAGGSIIAVAMPNIRGLIAGLPGLHSHPFATFLLTLAFSAAALIAAAWCITSMRPSLRSSFILAVIVTILVSYHALGYDLILLLPFLLLRLASNKPSIPQRRTDLLALILLYVIPFADRSWPAASNAIWFAVLIISLWRWHDARSYAVAESF